MKKTFLAGLVAALFILFAAPSDSSAEKNNYAGVYYGAAFPHVAEATYYFWDLGLYGLGEVNYDSGSTFGGKLGTILPVNNNKDLSWLVELDINAQSVDLKKYHLGIDYPTVGDLRILSATGNILLGYEGSELIKPYAGFGAGVASAEQYLDNIDGTAYYITADDLSFTWLALAGADLVLNERISIFAEYRYAGANFDFDYFGERHEVKYRASLLYGGLKYHF